MDEGQSRGKQCLSKQNDIVGLLGEENSLLDSPFHGMSLTDTPSDQTELDLCSLQCTSNNLHDMKQNAATLSYADGQIVIKQPSVPAMRADDIVASRNQVERGRDGSAEKHDIAASRNQVGRRRDRSAEKHDISASRNQVERRRGGSAEKHESPRLTGMEKWLETNNVYRKGMQQTDMEVASIRDLNKKPQRGVESGQEKSPHKDAGSKRTLSVISSANGDGHVGDAAVRSTKQIDSDIRQRERNSNKTFVYSNMTEETMRCLNDKHRKPTDTKSPSIRKKSYVSKSGVSNSKSSGKATRPRYSNKKSNSPKSFRSEKSIIAKSSFSSQKSNISKSAPGPENTILQPSFSPQKSNISKSVSGTNTAILQPSLSPRKSNISQPAPGTNTAIRQPSFSPQKSNISKSAPGSENTILQPSFSPQKSYISKPVSGTENAILQPSFSPQLKGRSPLRPQKDDTLTAFNEQNNYLSRPSMSPPKKPLSKPTFSPKKNDATKSPLSLKKSYNSKSFNQHKNAISKPSSNPQLNEILKPSFSLAKNYIYKPPSSSQKEDLANPYSGQPNKDILKPSFSLDKNYISKSSFSTHNGTSKQSTCQPKQDAQRQLSSQEESLKQNYCSPNSINSEKNTIPKPSIGQANDENISKMQSEQKTSGPSKPAFCPLVSLESDYPIQPKSEDKKQSWIDSSKTLHGTMKKDLSKPSFDSENSDHVNLRLSKENTDLLKPSFDYEKDDLSYPTFRPKRGDLSKRSPSQENIGLSKPSSGQAKQDFMKASIKPENNDHSKPALGRVKYNQSKPPLGQEKNDLSNPICSPERNPLSKPSVDSQKNDHSNPLFSQENTDLLKPSFDSGKDNLSYPPFCQKKNDLSKPSLSQENIGLSKPSFGQTQDDFFKAIFNTEKNDLSKPSLSRENDDLPKLQLEKNDHSNTLCSPEKNNVSKPSLDSKKIDISEQQLTRKNSEQYLLDSQTTTDERFDSSKPSDKEQPTVLTETLLSPKTNDGRKTEASLSEILKTPMRSLKRSVKKFIFQENKTTEDAPIKVMPRQIQGIKHLQEQNQSKGFLDFQNKNTKLHDEPHNRDDEDESDKQNRQKRKQRQSQFHLLDEQRLEHEREDLLLEESKIEIKRNGSYKMKTSDFFKHQFGPIQTRSEQERCGVTSQRIIIENKSEVPEASDSQEYVRKFYVHVEPNTSPKNLASLGLWSHIEKSARGLYSSFTAPAEETEMTKVKKCGFQCLDSSAYPADWDSDWLTYTDDVTEVAAQDVTQSDIQDAYFDQEEPDSNCDQNQSHNVFYQVGEAAPVYTGQLLAMAMASQVQEVGTEYSEWETGLLVDVFGQLKKYREGDEKSKEVEPNRNMFFQSEGGPPVYTGQLLNAFLAPQLQDGGVEYFVPFEMSSYEPDPFSSKDCLQVHLPAETKEVKDLPADLNIEVKKVEVPPTDLKIEINKGETLSQDVGVEVNKGEKLPENLSVKVNKPVVKDDWDTVLEMALIF